MEAERQFQRTLEAVQEVSDDIMADAWEPLLNNLGHVYRKLRWGTSTRDVSFYAVFFPVIFFLSGLSLYFNQLDATSKDIYRHEIMCTGSTA